MRQTHAVMAAVAAVVAALSMAPAYAQSDVSSRLSRLERDMQILQQQMGRGGPAPAATSAPADSGGGSAALVQMEMRVSAIESQMRELNGRLEELGLKLNQMDKNLERKMGDAEFRLKTLEDAQRGAAEGKGPTTASAAPGVPPGTKPIAPMPAPGAQASAPPAASSAPVLLPPGTPDEQFKFAFDFLKQNDYIQGEKAMRAFADAHPNHPLTGNALFWLGQMAFVNKDYTKSAVAFAQSYEKFPDGSKAPESLQKLGMSLANLNKKDEACTAFKQFQTQYPTAPVATKQSVQAESIRLGCK